MGKDAFILIIQIYSDEIRKGVWFYREKGKLYGLIERKKQGVKINKNVVECVNRDVVNLVKSASMKV